MKPPEWDVDHLSHAAEAAADGGIAAAVADLVAAQQQAGLSASWLTADRHHAWVRDRTLLAEVRSQTPDLVHLHGLWRSPTRIAVQLARGDGRHVALPLVVAPHGMLDPWAMAHNRLKKQVVWRLWERRALEAARCLQALCPVEALAISELGLSAPVAVIPSGVTLPELTTPLPSPPWSGRIPSGEKVLLFLGRFHAKKGLIPLLEAWSRIQREALRYGWWLVLVGYGDEGALAARVAAERIERCLVSGPCFGAQKLACYQGASAFVLPSCSEGLPMAALEALSWELPSVLSPACNLPEAFAAGAALAVQPAAEDLARGLAELCRLRAADRAAMGAAGRALVAESFSWPRVARQCAGLYDWLLAGGEMPEFVNSQLPA